MLEVLSRISFHTPQEFIAPIPTRDTTEVLSIQNNIPYWFNVRVDNPGWYLLLPNGKKAKVLQEAASYERLEYLKQLSRFFVFALFPINDNTWMVTPFNLSDGEQRGWHNGVPIRMYFAKDVKPLDIVETRQMGNHVLYYSNAHIRNMFQPTAKRHAQNLIHTHTQMLQQQDSERARQEKLSTLERRIETSLEFSGAYLMNWQELTPNDFQIAWEIDGRKYNMRVDQNLRVLSAGVCLAGTDRFHSLSSVVNVMQDRQQAIDTGNHYDN